MREVKFRAWDKSVNKMYSSGFLIDHEGTVDFPEGGLDWHGYNNDNLTVMQFTGLKDKNGKEIYEGDILREGQTATFHKHAKVVWDVSRWRLICMCGDPYEDFLKAKDGIVDDVEVIGNIYENPDLMKV